ncbi:hypothetical protein GCM10020358_01730 [Amorphoplanes nipponensis]
MAGGAREEAHEDFLADKVDIMVATSAFGMGIDKPNIRWVAHVALPDSPDSYFQEIGRMGRDGEPSRALLLWRAEDEAIQRFFTGGSPDVAELRELAAALRAGPATKTALKDRTGLGPRKLGQLLGLLEQVGAAVAGSGNKWTVPVFARAAGRGGRGRGRRVRAPAGRAALPHRHDARVRAEQRVSLPDLLALLRRGSHPPVRALRQLCRGRGRGDRRGDRRRAVRRAQHGAARRVGPGMVMGYEEDRMTVLFDEVGYKTLSVPVVQEHALLVAEKKK